MTTIVGTPATGPSAGGPCIEYLTIDQVRSTYGDDVSDWTDAQIQQRIDQMVSELEDQLGHTFGRAIVVYGTSASDLVAVTAAALVISGDTYTFADYPTLGTLVASANAADSTYSLELLPQVNPSTPSTILNVADSATCGPDYEDRVVLCMGNLWLQLNGGSSKVFLPLPIYSVNEVTENGTELTSDYMWAIAGQTWITRKCCSCTNVGECIHPVGRWSGRYPANIEVTYRPIAWGKPPASLKGALTQAFGLRWNVGDDRLRSESFGGAYSYTNQDGGTAANQSWSDILGGAPIRRWAIQFQP